MAGEIGHVAGVQNLQFRSKRQRTQQNPSKNIAKKEEKKDEK